MNKDISILFELNHSKPSFEELLINSYVTFDELRSLKYEINSSFTAYSNMSFICDNYNQFKKDPVFHELTNHSFHSAQEAFDGLSKAMKTSIEKIREFITKFFEWLDITFGLICKNAISVIDKYQKILKEEDTLDKLKKYEIKHEPIQVYIDYLREMIAYSRVICESINKLKNITNPEDLTKIDELTNSVEKSKRDDNFEKARTAYEEAKDDAKLKKQEITSGGWSSESDIGSLKDQINNCSGARQNIIRYKSTITQILNSISTSAQDEQKTLNKSKHEHVKEFVTSELSDCIKGMNTLINESSKKIQQFIKVATGKGETEVK